MVVAIVVPFVLTLAVGKRKLPAAAMDDKQAEELARVAAGLGINVAAGVMAEVMENRGDKEKSTANQLVAYLTGKVIPLKEIGDGVFSEGIVGDGFAIIPESDVLCAPADAAVAALMEDSRHACGLKLDNGMEILLHVGLDTVDMQGDGFEYLVSQGQRVAKGTPLLRFDRDKIRAAGHPDTTICVITEPGEAGNIRFLTGQRAEVNTTVVATFE